MSVSDWRSHLNSLKAGKLNGGNKRVALEEMLQLPAAPNSAANKGCAAQDTNTIDKENVHYRNIDQSFSRNYVDETQQSWPEYSGIEDDTCYVDAKDDSRDDDGIIEEVSDSASGADYDYSGHSKSTNSVVKALLFGGGDSIEVERSDENPNSSSALPRSFQPRRSQRAAGLPPADADFLAAEEDRRPPRDRTPQPQHRAGPEVTDSPSTTQLTSQSSKAVAVQHILLPADKEAGRISVSPTSSRRDSAFGRQLQASGEGAEAGAPHTRPGHERGRGAQHQPADEWKVAHTEHGKKYYYNRRTRVSAWRLPPGALCAETEGGQPAPRSNQQQRQPGSVDTQSAHVPGGFAEARSYAAEAGAVATSHVQRPQEQAHELAQAQDTAVEYPTVAGAGVSLHCIFCGEQESALGLPYFEHMAACINSDSSDSTGVLQCINGYLTQLAGTQRAQHMSSASAPAEADGDFDWNEQSYRDYSASCALALNQVGCSICGRTFADESRLGKHAPACLESSIKRAPYSGSRRRIVGTPMELLPARFISPGSPGSGPRSTPPSSAKKSAGGSASKQLAGSPVKVVAVAAHVCPKCDASVISKEQLLKHLRACLLEDDNVENAASTQQNNAGVEAIEQLCPFCGKLNHDLTQFNRHLAICSKKRLAASKPGSPRFGQSKA